MRWCSEEVLPDGARVRPLQRADAGRPEALLLVRNRTRRQPGPGAGSRGRGSTRPRPKTASRCHADRRDRDPAGRARAALMFLYEHRVNTIAHLERVPADRGVEVDLRDYDGAIRLAHDPFTGGERLEDFL